ncbi:helix-turn-helix domain-containing protein [Nocardia brasiliensis]|uniref:helix-turn-helix domain-containing protein n=1 Tax=Nocardia brasiliensis TaxID=37326 RepID=UPI0024548AAA|nr:helix-turn-helix domain-containing protein [Nocardia brasiliensis]
MVDLSAPDPGRITTLAELTQTLNKLRRRAAGPGRVQLSVREIAKRTGRAPSTLDPYLRGLRLCPEDTFEEILVALGIPRNNLRHWLDAWERVAEAHRQPETSHRRALDYQTEFMYRINEERVHTPRIGIITGDLRRVKNTQIWINSENTHMQMARFEDFSTSAIIRFGGARRDRTGTIVHDSIAEDLDRTVSGHRPVVAGTAITTGSGQLVNTHGVDYVIHVAAVHGEPGEGYRQVNDIGTCVTNACAEAERVCAIDNKSRAVLIPLLGTGEGGGEIRRTTEAMLGAALDHFAAQTSRIHTLRFLAYTAAELTTVRDTFETNPHLTYCDPTAAARPEQESP